MLVFLLEAAFRSLLMASAVWACIRMLRVEAVLAQKIAWVLVLLAAGTMPLVMRAPFLALNRAVEIPLRKLIPQPPKPVPAPTDVQTRVVAPIPKPSAAHLLPRDTEPTENVDPPIPLPDFSTDSETATPSNPRPLTVSAPPVLKSSTQPVMDTHRVTPVTTKPSFWTWARLRSVAFSAYCIVLGFFVLRMIAGLCVALRIWRRAEPIGGIELGEFSCIDSKVLRVRVSPDLATPVTIGSTIILPADFESWDDAKLRVVLAHEQSHVRQGDFYLQLVAAIHVAVFWFSPLGWWLQRKLSELGEALSDRAGLAQAPDAASYAQVLLEFAALPRKNSWSNPLAGVAMARSSNLSGRIERILNDRRFRLAFLGGRRHAFLAAILVPVALLAAVGLIRIAPAVEAAQTNKVSPLTGQVNGKVAGQVTGSDLKNDSGDKITGEVSGELPDREIDLAQTGTLGQAPPAPNPPSPDVEAPPAPEQPEMQEPEAPPTPDHKHGTHVWINHGDDNGESFAIVHENGDGSVRWNGEYNDELGRVRRKLNLKGDYVWFEHDGKSYVLTDPAILAQANDLFKEDPVLKRQMAELDMRMKGLDKEMAALEPEMEKAKLPGPEFQQKMAKLQAQLATLNTETQKRLAELSKSLSDQKLEEVQERLGDLQSKMGDIQGQIGEIQGEVGERQGQVGDRQGKIGEQMGVLGEEMGKIGEQQGKQAEAASRKFKSILDQALKDGKAKPID